MYIKTVAKAKKILIETETTETFRLQITGPTATRSYCPECETVEELLDLNSAADVSGATAREIFSRVEQGELHSPESSNGHLLICRASLEQAMNARQQELPGPRVLKESL